MLYIVRGDPEKIINIGRPDSNGLVHIRCTNIYGAVVDGVSTTKTVTMWTGAGMFTPDGRFYYGLFQYSNTLDPEFSHLAGVIGIHSGTVMKNGNIHIQGKNISSLFAVFNTEWIKENQE